MKLYLFPTFLAALLTFACEQNDNTTENPSPTTELPDKIEACEYFTIEEIADFWGWAAGTVNNTLLMELEDYDQSNCMYFIPSDDKFFVRTIWKGTAAQQNEVLANQFAGLLANGEESLTYESINTEAGTESILGTGPDRDDKTIYILRTRYDNELEVILEAALRNISIDEARAQLVEILQQL